MRNEDNNNYYSDYDNSSSNQYSNNNNNNTYNYSGNNYSNDNRYNYYGNNGGYNNNNYNNYNNNYNASNYYDGTVYDSSETQSKIMTRSFIIVLAALLVTAISASLVLVSKSIEEMVFSGFTAWLVLEFAVVMGSSFAIAKRKTVLAAVLFAAYSVINGLTLSVIFYAYDFGSIQEVFLLCAGMFAGMAIIGATTRINLTKMGSILMMALWGVILVTLANIFFIHSSGIDLLMDYVGVAIFVGLTAYDTQKMKKLASSGEMSDMNIIALYCGMELYLDFINLFLRLLSIFGKQKN